MDQKQNIHNKHESRSKLGLSYLTQKTVNNIIQEIITLDTQSTPTRWKPTQYGFIAGTIALKKLLIAICTNKYQSLIKDQTIFETTDFDITISIDDAKSNASIDETLKPTLPTELQTESEYIEENIRLEQPEQIPNYESLLQLSRLEWFQTVSRMRYSPPPRQLLGP